MFVRSEETAAMFPLKMPALVALSAFGVCATFGSAEAGRIYYTKNGHKYWFDINSPRGKALVAKRAAEQRWATTKLVNVQKTDEGAQSAAVSVSQHSAPVRSMILPAPHNPSPIRSISYDFQNGIKRTVMIDGAVFDEPFDPRAFFRAAVVSEARPTVAMMRTASGEGAAR
jgi:hypothetical protein